MNDPGFMEFRENLSRRRVLVRSGLLKLFWNECIEEMVEDASNQMLVINEFLLEEPPFPTNMLDEFMQPDF